MNLSVRKRVHVASVNFRMLKILQERHGNYAVNDLVERSEVRVDTFII